MIVRIMDENLSEFAKWAQGKGAQNIHILKAGKDTKGQNWAEITMDIEPPHRGPKVRLDHDLIRKYRSQGKSYALISEMLKVSKSSVAKICKDINVDDNTFETIIPTSIKKLEQGIKALEQQIKLDCTTKDYRIHMKQLNDYKNELAKRKENADRHPAPKADK